MSELKPKKTTIKLGDKEYGLLFNLNAIDDIQDRFDIPISELSDLLSDERKSFKALRGLLTILINEALSDDGQEPVDERFVGRKITMDNIEDLSEAIQESFKEGLPEGDGENFPQGK